MRIIDTEPELIREIIEETELVETRKHKSFTVHVGHHPTMGRIAVIAAPTGTGAVVELD